MTLGFPKNNIILIRYRYFFKNLFYVSKPLVTVLIRMDRCGSRQPFKCGSGSESETQVWTKNMGSGRRDQKLKKGPATEQVPVPWAFQEYKIKHHMKHGHSLIKFNNLRVREPSVRLADLVREKYTCPVLCAGAIRNVHIFTVPLRDRRYQHPCTIPLGSSVHTSKQCSAVRSCNMIRAPIHCSAMR